MNLVSLAQLRRQSVIDPQWELLIIADPNHGIYMDFASTYEMLRYAS